MEVWRGNSFTTSRSTSTVGWYNLTILTLLISLSTSRPVDDTTIQSAPPMTTFIVKSHSVWVRRKRAMTATTTVWLSHWDNVALHVSLPIITHSMVARSLSLWLGYARRASSSFSILNTPMHQISKQIEITTSSIYLDNAIHICIVIMYSNTSNRADHAKPQSQKQVHHVY